jgi:hypothetical protein
MFRLPGAFLPGGGARRLNTGGRMRISPDDLHAIMHEPSDLGDVILEPLDAAQDAADALRGVFDSLEEAFLDDAHDPSGDEHLDERQRLRALRAAITLFDLLAQRGA